ncbi:polyketide synthase dehydratase domain-containing protein, partial [Streptomyces sp. NPDC056500]|uniref:polyketide synthase dehydratase domain-containing protein n=1 Tax=Streptomyces sp. NPDC056500 TaxID=3345840 RepID=UPI0036AF4FAF
VHNTPLLPGTAFIELALHATEHTDSQHLEELALEAPLLVPSDGSVHIQVAIGQPDDVGRRTVSVHSRPEDSGLDAPWTRHASGTLGPTATHAPVDDLAVWPPPGAQPIDATHLYEDLDQGGYGYGPTFQGLRKAWRLGNDVYAEVALPEDQHDNAAHYGIHPALLDAALHANALNTRPDPNQPIHLPFTWNNVTLHATGATTLRVRLTPTAPNTITLFAADGSGRAVLTADSMVSRPLAEGQLRSGGDNSLRDALFLVQWTEVPATESVVPSRIGMIGECPFGLGEALRADGTEVLSYADISEVADAERVPETVLLAIDPGNADGPSKSDGSAGNGSTGGPREGAADSQESSQSPVVSSHRAAHDIADTVRAWLADERLSASRLVVVTRDGVAGVPDGHHDRLVSATARGFVRTAQSEHPDRFALLDLDRAWSPGVVRAAIGSDEPELAVSGEALLARRLARPDSSDLVLPGEGPWRLDVTERGTLENLALVSAPEVSEPLSEGQIRVSMRSAGLNFRDVLITLGMYPGEALLGSEGAGVVTEVGPGVSGLTEGDRVMGLFSGGFGPVAVADQQAVVRIPESWSFAEAAAIPIVYLTAYYALVDIARAQPGERVLIHAAAGGVGMAAVQLAHHLNLEIYATASPTKWPAVTALGVPTTHIASSRTLDFENHIHTATNGNGVNIVI